MPISLILTPFDYFQIRPTFAVTPNLILEPCPMQDVDDEGAEGDKAELRRELKELETNLRAMETKMAEKKQELENYAQQEQERKLTES